MAVRTGSQVKQWLAQQGKTQRDWALAHGYSPYLVTRVINGVSRASRGKGHEIAVALGMKAKVSS
jgi:gp16 family phage-associated protein